MHPHLWVYASHWIPVSPLMMCEAGDETKKFLRECVFKLFSVIPFNQDSIKHNHSAQTYIKLVKVGMR